MMSRQHPNASFLVSLAEKAFPFFPQSLTPRCHELAGFHIYFIPKDYPTRISQATQALKLSLDAMHYSEESFGNLALARGGKNGNLALARGGKNGYERVRGGQGTRHDKWQGYTKGKKKTTELYDTAEEAAVALARLEQDIALRLIDLEDKKPRKKRKTSGAPTPARLPFDCLHSRAHRTSQARHSCPSRRRRWSSTRPR